MSLREILLNIFKRDIGGPDITLFGIFHILYFLIIIGVTILLIFLFNKKDQSVKKKLLDIYCLILVGLYLGDFFVHPFIYGDNSLIVDKLPFHLCTIACPLIALCRIFPSKLKHIRCASTILGFVGALMYLTCPNGAVGIGVKAFSYTILQTFAYHGVLFTYGILALVFGDITPNIKKIWIELIMIACLDLISLGANAAYSTSEHHYDWFFTTGSSFGMSPYVMPFIMFGIISLMCLAIYGLYYLFKYKVFKKKEAIQE